MGGSAWGMQDKHFFIERRVSLWYARSCRRLLSYQQGQVSVCAFSSFLGFVQDDKGPSTDAASLVRQLVCAAVHSKAAYGHAMAAGHLSSLYNFALLQTVRPFFTVFTTFLTISTSWKLFLTPTNYAQRTDAKNL